MKYAKFAAVVVFLFVLGYVLGPTLNPLLVSDRKVENQMIFSVEVNGGATYQIDLAKYEESELPEVVTIEKQTSIPTASGAGVKPLRRDEKVKLLSLDGGKLLVQTMDGVAKGQIQPRDTDIFQILAKRKFEQDAAKIVGTSPPDQAMPSTPSPGVDPVANPATGVAPQPTPVAVVEPQPAPVAVVEPEPEPEPETPKELSEEQVVALMKESIAGGAVKEFKSDQVKGWKIGDMETIDGTEYQTGLAAYEAQTIFGVKPVQAKALIKDGKIERWVYAKSGMEIQ
jgi:hypothetical protein